MTSSIAIHISIDQQSLELIQAGVVLALYPISSARNGLGFGEGSYCTPIGNFIISEKFGDGAPIYTTFKSREATGIWDSVGEPVADDLITSRILWLDGTDLENANSKQRFIYIHGTNHEELIGTPASCGCIRMRNADIIELFDKTPLGTPVTITHTPFLLSEGGEMLS